MSLIDASPHDAGTAYVAVKNYQNDDRTPYIFKTDDYGKTLDEDRRTASAPTISCTRFARIPRGRACCIAGTEHGIYVSFDDGDAWQSLSLNLPDTQVSDIVVEANDLVIATHGRSFYVLDNIAPIRQLKDDVSRQRAARLRARGGDAACAAGGDRLLPEGEGRQGDDRDSRRARTGDPHLQRTAGETRSGDTAIPGSVHRRRSSASRRGSIASCGTCGMRERPSFPA